MGAIKDAADAAFRDYVTDGVPSSGANPPDKAAIRALFDLVEETIEAMTDVWDTIEVAANSTDEPLQLEGDGEPGNRLFGLHCMPTDTTIGAISYKDGEDGTPVEVHPAKERTNDDPFFIAVRFEAEVGPILLTVGANVNVVAMGRFRPQ